MKVECQKTKRLLAQMYRVSDDARALQASALKSGQPLPEEWFLRFVTDAREALDLYLDGILTSEGAWGLLRELSREWMAQKPQLSRVQKPRAGEASPKFTLSRDYHGAAQRINGLTTAQAHEAIADFLSVTQNTVRCNHWKRVQPYLRRDGKLYSYDPESAGKIATNEAKPLSDTQALPTW